METRDANDTKQIEIRTCHGMDVVSTNEEYSEEEPIHMRSNGPMEYNSSPGNNIAAPPAITDKMKNIEAFQHIYPKGSKFQHYLSIEGFAGISPGWCEGIVVAHDDSCVLVQFRVDSSTKDKLCDDLEEWPLNAFWDGTLYEKHGRIYHIRQYPIADVLLAFDLWNALDESSSSIWRADPEGRRRQPDPRFYLNKRVAKFFFGQLFLGTVVGCAKRDLWKIYYDDGDDEEYNLAELIRYLKLYRKSVKFDSETAACASLRNSGKAHVPVREELSLPSPDRETLKKVLNTFIDVEVSMRIGITLITEKQTRAAEPIIRDFNAAGAIDDEWAGRSQTPLLDLEDFDESGVMDDDVGSTTQQEGLLGINCCNTVEIHHLNEKESMDCARQGSRLCNTVASCDDTAYPLLIGHPLPGESEHALSKPQSQWADFPIGSPVMFKGKLESTVECVYFSFRDKLYRYGIRMCRGGSRLQVRGTDLALIIDCQVSDRHTVQLVGRSSDTDNRFMVQGSDDDAILGAGGVSNALNIPLRCVCADSQIITTDHRAKASVGIGTSRSGLPTVVSPLDVAHHQKPEAVSDATSMFLSIPNLESKKHNVDPEYEPYVRKEARGYAVETPALRRGIGGRNRRRIKLNNRPWLKRGIYGRSSRIN